MPYTRLWPDIARIDPRANPARDAIAVYLLELDMRAPLALLPAYLTYLGSDEGERWRAIRTAERKWQFLQSRVLRRVLLAAYTERDPAELEFASDEWGRERLADNKLLHFSMTQCASHVAMAVGSEGMLGIDAETIFPVRPSFMHIARDHFNGADLEQLLACPEPRRYSRFLELWTLKQAYLKALGRGAGQTMAHCNFSRTSTGLLVCQDSAPLADGDRPSAFHSEKWVNICQLALAYRAGLPVSFRYLNGSSLAQTWPHTQLASSAFMQPTREALPLLS